MLGVLALVAACGDGSGDSATADGLTVERRAVDGDTGGLIATGAAPITQAHVQRVGPLLLASVSLPGRFEVLVSDDDGASWGPASVPAVPVGHQYAPHISGVRAVGQELHARVDGLGAELEVDVFDGGGRSTIVRVMGPAILISGDGDPTHWDRAVPCDDPAPVAGPCAWPDHVVDGLAVLDGHASLDGGATWTPVHIDPAPDDELAIAFDWLRSLPGGGWTAAIRAYGTAGDERVDTFVAGSQDGIDWTRVGPLQGCEVLYGGPRIHAPLLVGGRWVIATSCGNATGETRGETRLYAVNRDDVSVEEIPGGTLDVEALDGAVVAGGEALVPLVPSEPTFYRTVGDIAVITAAG